MSPSRRPGNARANIACVMSRYEFCAQRQAAHRADGAAARVGSPDGQPSRPTATGPHHGTAQRRAAVRTATRPHHGARDAKPRTAPRRGGVMRPGNAPHRPVAVRNDAFEYCAMLGRRASRPARRSDSFQRFLCKPNGTGACRTVDFMNIAMKADRSGQGQGQLSS